MNRLDPEAWQRVSRHLDEVLDLDAGARLDYLARIETEQPREAAALNALLVEPHPAGVRGFSRRDARSCHRACRKRPTSPARGLART